MFNWAALIPVSVITRALPLLALGAWTVEAADLKVRYDRDIQPILADNCYRCHGPDEKERKARLRLDVRDIALKPAKSGLCAIVPGQPSGSELIRRITSNDEDELMPPRKTGKKLTAGQMDLLRRWIDEGAIYTTHWAFTKPVRPPIPPTIAKGWSRNAIDRFVLARLEEQGIKPSPEADRITLFRRLHLDLIGLPPKLNDIEAFFSDNRPDAYERVVDRLLASPHYGERWGRHWLDVARYADSNGYSIDAPRQIWKYRDWVIDTLNRNLPFDEFVVEQLAGDLLPGAGLEQKIATGFHRNTQINQEGGIDKEQFRIESIIDRVNTTGTAFLGLTIGCCQCHDHKFDPLTQRDYYGLFAFLNNDEEPELPIAPAEAIAQAEAIEHKVEAYLASLPVTDLSIYDRMLAWERSLTPTQRQAQSQAVRETFDVQFANRSNEQKLIVLTAYVENAEQTATNRTIIQEWRKTKPYIPTTLVLSARPQPRRSYLFVKGDFTRDGGTVGPSVPAVLHPLPSGTDPNRLGLARWIVDPENPLLARVMVNRIWQQYFGRGLVETENDFGTQGALPSHPGLLDWLATELVQSAPTGRAATPWNLKHIHRLMVTSATYRQSSHARPDLDERDPNNQWLARQSRLRLDAEVVRDVILGSSGLLNEKLGGPSVFPPQPDGVMKLGQSQRPWNDSQNADRYRRGLYTHYWRATPHPALSVFDAPDAFGACTRRLRSNTPLQALTLLNDRQYYELAEALSARLLREGPPKDADRLEYAFRLCVARPPRPDEREVLERLFSKVKEESTQPSQPVDEKGTRLEAWTTVARVLLNLDETITRE